MRCSFSEKNSVLVPFTVTQVIFSAGFPSISFNILTRMFRQVDQHTELEFSRPWELSDFVLLVEEERFYVHRGIMALCSSAFSRLFHSAVGENLQTVLLPGRKANEIREMLLVIYPASQKPISRNNCSFLLALARDFEMRTLTAKCEDFLLEALNWQRGWYILNSLILAESYELMRLRADCIRRTQELRLGHLQNPEFYERVAHHTQLEILGKLLYASESEVSRLQNKVKEVAQQATNALRSVTSLASVLAEHIRFASNVNARGIRFTTEQDFDAIEKDCADRRFLRDARDGKSLTCPGLAAAYAPLENIQSTLENIQESKE